jgi:molybdopterin synthase catalytic subunit
MIVACKIDISVGEDDFDSSVELEKLRSAGVGAIASFTGIVRDEATGPALIALTLEHYPEMTTSQLCKIAVQAADRWQLGTVIICHRVGRLLPEDNIVFVGTSSAHRKAAFDACAFIMDYLKTEAPFWKKEETTQGTRWIDARISDDEALKKW